MLYGTIFCTMDQTTNLSNNLTREDEVLIIEKFINKCIWINNLLITNKLPIEITGHLHHKGRYLYGFELQLDKHDFIQIKLCLDRFKSRSKLDNVIKNCNIRSESEESIIIDFKNDAAACANTLYNLAKLEKVSYDLANARFIICSDIFYTIRYDANLNYIDKKLNDNNIINHIRDAYAKQDSQTVITQQQSYTSICNNIDWNKIIFIPILLIGVIYPMLWRNVGGLEDFMKEVASEYNAPLSEVENEILSAIRSEDSWFPLPNTIWYVTKDNGEDVTVGRSDVFGTDVYKDKLDKFFYLEFWRGRKSLEEMQMDAIREQMGRK